MFIEPLLASDIFLFGEFQDSVSHLGYFMVTTTDNSSDVF